MPSQWDSISSANFRAGIALLLADLVARFGIQIIHTDHASATPAVTLMNKGLELIEACWLFSIKPGQVQIVVHSQKLSMASGHR